MKHAIVAATLLATTTWYAPATAAADPPTYTSAAYAYAINDAGDIVGTITGPGFASAARWDRNGNVTLLGTPGAQATVINAAGTAAGTGPSWGPVIRWDQRGRVTTFTSLDGLGPLFVYGISADGTVAGTSVDGDGGDRAIRTTADGRLVVLPVLGNGSFTGVSDMNASGITIGSSEGRGVRWDTAGRLTVLSPLPGGSFSGTAAITDAGAIVGISGLPVHAVRWDTAGRVADLGVLPGGSTSAAVDINANGLVVGTANDAAGRTHVVRWDRGGAIADLGPVDSGGVVGINIVGTVVGCGRGPQDLTVRPLSWDPAGRQHPLPLPPGAVAGCPTGINSTGVIAGVVQFPDSTTRAVRWNGAGVAYLPVPQHQPHPAGTR